MYTSWKKLLIKIVLSFQNKIYKLQDECDALQDKLRSKNTENHSLKKQLKESQKPPHHYKKLERSQKRKSKKLK